MHTFVFGIVLIIVGMLSEYLLIPETIETLDDMVHAITSHMTQLVGGAVIVLSDKFQKA